MTSFSLPVWPYVYGGPSGGGKIRVLPEDFIVEETLGFEPSGAGEHAFLQIRKTGENTEYVARQLARFAEIRQRDIGFAGLKDRHAVTTQWFSVWLPGKPDPDWAVFASASIEVLQVVRHARKLQRGVLAGNRFQLLVRDWRGDRDKADARLAAIKAQGIANYFGAQRFGHQGRNVEQALRLFQGKKVSRELRGIYLSAARSFLFNQLLAARVAAQNWNRPLPGDVYMFDKSHSRFKADAQDQDIAGRVSAGAIHPTGVLWGQGDSGVSGEALALEMEAIERFSELVRGLQNSGVEIERRPLRVNVPDLAWRFADDQLHLSFSLPAGSYATALLREVIDWDD
ncbi:tRNA pseudouridine(13) synthase TruD [Methylomicrobium sp. Wu6]|uniref:tRNA pseudouridine(13) synthase TruD n=1 Tax=Methylomicrobium sp. Wu6 TaxID=3107928 RepID=UPI002DD6895F|nr:tRNA pseudouridine(13) synthase TruD [Methylomicrobium sp. Wu6]MEC4748063.1 tRNA pseudouridine(13) synthase TruD [Methylomicrobium sp. Wu6]